jgi:hypothetical protein
MPTTTNAVDDEPSVEGGGGDGVCEDEECTAYQPVDPEFEILDPEKETDDMTLFHYSMCVRKKSHMDVSFLQEVDDILKKRGGGGIGERFVKSGDTLVVDDSVHSFTFDEFHSSSVESESPPSSLKRSVSSYLSCVVPDSGEEELPIRRGAKHHRTEGGCDDVVGGNATKSTVIDLTQDEVVGT